MPKPSRRPGAADSDVVVTLQLKAALGQAQNLHHAGKVAEAAVLCQRILAAKPGNAGALHLMGNLALQTGATDIAIGSLQRALTVSPRSAAILSDLGQALSAGGRHAEAISAYRKALTFRPNDPAVYVGLGDAQLDHGTHVDALKSYRKALSLDPDHARAAHMVAALSGNGPDDTAKSYASLLFDAYAETFESHLAKTLDYHVPEHLYEALEQYRPAGGRFSAVLDLGCGTGLMGAALVDLAVDIDGIDIAPRMIEVVAAKRLYRALRAGDLVDVMNRDPDFAGPYDLVTAADVFIYVGPLDAVFPAVRRVLADGGLFAFSVEEADRADVAIRSSGRFAHRRSYIADLAAAHGLVVIEDRANPIRKERNSTIGGRLFVLRAGEPARL
jgi:predicted TPR repeat methyltransferase